jgi:YHS domain-containing protein
MLKQFVLITTIGSLCAIAQDSKTAALEGLDPVLLTEGQEVPGQGSISLANGRFLYQFSSEQTRDRFRKNPELYGIQLEGACARMGPPVGGSPDAYFVYDHRIYVFGSSECYKHFTANPKKYLESEQPKPAWNPTAATRAQGKVVLDKAVEAMGGTVKWGGVQSYLETRHATDSAGEITIRVAARLPDSFVSETTAGSNTFGSLVTPADAVSLFRGGGRRLPQSFGRALLNDWRRNLLPLLLDRNRAGFEAYYAGRSGDVELIAVKDHGIVSTLFVDRESSRVVAIAWEGRTSDGFARLRVSYSDYRPVGGLQLPFRAAGTLEETGAPARSWTVESYELNPADIDMRLRPPAKIQE